MKINGVRVPLWLIAFVAVSFLVSVLAIYTAWKINTIFSSDFLTTPYVYTQSEYEAINPVVCPGDKLQFEYEAITERTEPFLVRIHEFITSPDGREVHFQDFHWFLADAEMSGWYEGEILVPEELPPGDYVYRRAGAIPPSSSNPATFDVPFVLDENCFGVSFTIVGECE